MKKLFIKGGHLSRCVVKINPTSDGSYKVATAQFENIVTKDNVSLNLAKKNSSFGMQFEDQEFAKRIRKKRMTRRIKH